MEKSILVSIIAVFAVLALIANVSASDLIVGGDNGFDVTINGADVETYTVSGIEAGETIPIKVVFTAADDASDVTVRAWIDGYRSDISAKTRVFELIDGSVYTKTLSLKLPSDIDPTEDYILTIRISNQANNNEQDYQIKLQRESYKIEVLSAEVPQSATPGSVIPVNIVLKNWGMHKLEDIFVKVRIPDLGIEKKVYFSDLNPLDEDEITDTTVREASRTDSVERTVYLQIPDNAKSGIYSVEVEAFNLDSANVVKKALVISGIEEVSNIFSGAGSKSLAPGQEVTYNFVIVNSGSKMKVYTLTPGETDGLIIDVDPIVTVAADSSTTVTVKVKAAESITEGTHIATINIASDGINVKTVSFSANVERVAVSSSVVVLTIVLAIVFVVLLIILIVLLTRKPAAAEAEETSYY